MHQTPPKRFDRCVPVSWIIWVTQLSAVVQNVSWILNVHVIKHAEMEDVWIHVQDIVESMQNARYLNTINRCAHVCLVLPVILIKFVDQFLRHQWNLLFRKILVFQIPVGRMQIALLDMTVEQYVPVVLDSSDSRVDRNAFLIMTAQWIRPV